MTEFILCVCAFSYKLSTMSSLWSQHFYNAHLPDVVWRGPFFNYIFLYNCVMILQTSSPTLNIPERVCVFMCVYYVTDSLPTRLCLPPSEQREFRAIMYPSKLSFRPQQYAYFRRNSPQTPTWVHRGLKSCSVLQTVTFTY